VAHAYRATHAVNVSRTHPSHARERPEREDSKIGVEFEETIHRRETAGDTLVDRRGGEGSGPQNEKGRGGRVAVLHQSKDLAVEGERVGVANEAGGHHKEVCLATQVDHAAHEESTTSHRPLRCEGCDDVTGSHVTKERDAARGRHDILHVHVRTPAVSPPALIFVPSSVDGTFAGGSNYSVAESFSSALFTSYKTILHMPNIVVRASEIAALAGMHEFRTQEDALAEVIAFVKHGKRKRLETKCEASLRGTSEGEVMSCAEELGVAGSSCRKIKLAQRELETATESGNIERINEAEVRHDNIKREELPTMKRSIVKSVERRAMDVAKGGGEDAPTLPSPLRDLGEQHVRMALGTVDESSILERAKQLDEHLANACPASMIQGEIGKHSGGKVFVRGVADAIDKGKYVVEIKRRRNRIFETVPRYERIQIEAYMRLYDVMDGVLIESFGNEIKMHWVERDDSLWDDVVFAVEVALDRELEFVE